MDIAYVFGPLLAHVLLVALVYLELGRQRFKAFKAKDVHIRDYKIVRGDEPDYAAKAARNVVNQFELPVLFHVLCLSAAVMEQVSMTLLVLLWMFAATRYAHSFVHVTSNNVKVRAIWFLSGFWVLMAAWAVFAFSLLQS